uniref:Uncharacterized protein n=1 Tax=Anopheles dirus TaxID=7168 RepID=A0A182NTR1_9DIPT
MKWNKIFVGKDSDKKERAEAAEKQDVPGKKKTIQKPCCKKCALVCKCKHHRRVLRSMAIPPPSGLLLN